MPKFVFKLLFHTIINCIITCLWKPIGRLFIILETILNKGPGDKSRGVYSRIEPTALVPIQDHTRSDKTCQRMNMLYRENTLTQSRLDLL